MGRLIGIARRERKRAPMEILESAEISEESGVANDWRGGVACAVLQGDSVAIGDPVALQVID